MVISTGRSATSTGIVLPSLGPPQALGRHCLVSGWAPGEDLRQCVASIVGIFLCSEFRTQDTCTEADRRMGSAGDRRPSACTRPE
jgi:hypothetical protein